MSRRPLTKKELLSIQLRLDTGDEDEELQWFPLFIVRPNGDIECQFGSDEISSTFDEMTIDRRPE